MTTTSNLFLLDGLSSIFYRFINSSSLDFNIKNSYSYNDFNELVSENNSYFGSISYQYDSQGNIVTISNSTNNITYTLSYDSSTNRLTSISKTTSSGTIQLSCDNYLFGRPFTYKGNTLNWNNRELTQYGSASFVYDGFGRRIQKNYGSRSTDYYYIENRLIYENISIENSNYTLKYLYDNDESPIGFIYNNEIYIFIKDILRNVIAIYKQNGSLICKYVYDAYGNNKCLNPNGTVNSTETFIGNLNPIRYRSYYFDAETNLYYLKSRYYDPEICRFISSDSIEYNNLERLHGLNLYGYCHNNPISYFDNTGHFSIGSAVALLGFAFLLGGASQLAINATQGSTGSELWRGVAGMALGSFANMAALITAPFTGGATFIFAAAIGALTTSGVNVIEKSFRGEMANWKQEGIDLLASFIANLFGNFVGLKMVPINNGWFQPQRFISVFLKPYGQRLIAQAMIGGISSFFFGSAFGYLERQQNNPDYEWYWSWING